MFEFTNESHSCKIGITLLCLMAKFHHCLLFLLASQISQEVPCQPADLAMCSPDNNNQVNSRPQVLFINFGMSFTFAPIY